MKIKWMTNENSKSYTEIILKKLNNVHKELHLLKKTNDHCIGRIIEKDQAASRTERAIMTIYITSKFSDSWKCI